MSPRTTGRRPDLRTVGWLLLTMTIAAAGGALFAALGLPAPWLTGSMTAIVAAAMAGLPVGLPARLRDVAFVLLGISMGSSATPESVAQMQAWPGSLALLALSVRGNSVRRRGLPRAGPRLGPGHRALRLDAGRLRLGGRAGGHQCRRPAARRAGPKHPDLHPGGPDARHAHLCRRRVERDRAGSDARRPTPRSRCSPPWPRAAPWPPCWLPAGSGRCVAGGDDRQRHPARHRPCPRPLPPAFGDPRLRRHRGGDRRPFSRHVAGHPAPDRARRHRQRAPGPGRLGRHRRRRHVAASACRSGSSGSPTRPVASKPWPPWPWPSTSTRPLSAPTTSCASLAST